MRVLCFGKRHDGVGIAQHGHALIKTLRRRQEVQRLAQMGANTVVAVDTVVLHRRKLGLNVILALWNLDSRISGGGITLCLSARSTLNWAPSKDAGSVPYSALSLVSLRSWPPKVVHPRAHHVEDVVLVDYQRPLACHPHW